jgi:hypothetical protein
MAQTLLTKCHYKHQFKASGIVTTFTDITLSFAINEQRNMVLE